MHFWKFKKTHSYGITSLIDFSLHKKLCRIIFIRFLECNMKHIVRTLNVNDIIFFQKSRFKSFCFFFPQEIDDLSPTSHIFHIIFYTAFCSLKTWFFHVVIFVNDHVLTLDCNESDDSTFMHTIGIVLKLILTSSSNFRDNLFKYIRMMIDHEKTHYHS